MDCLNVTEILGPLSEPEQKHAPNILYAEGNKDLLRKGLRVSVIGSREPSQEGITRARVLTEVLVQHDITVVSGLAKGIDTVAHKTAIAAGGKTIAVLGTPLSQAYPAENRSLLDAIKREHLAISQFPEGERYSRENFPRRNRTMALISDASVIVEAGEKSGTRHQGWEALKLGRLLFIMQNLAESRSFSWPKELVGHGAQVLKREDLPDILYDIPSFTAGGPLRLRIPWHWLEQRATKIQRWIRDDRLDRNSIRLACSEDKADARMRDN